MKRAKPSTTKAPSKASRVRRLAADAERRPATSDARRPAQPMPRPRGRRRRNTPSISSAMRADRQHRSPGQSDVQVARQHRGMPLSLAASVGGAWPPAPPGSGRPAPSTDGADDVEDRRRIDAEQDGERRPAARRSAISRRLRSRMRLQRSASPARRRSRGDRARARRPPTGSRRWSRRTPPRC